MLNPLRRFRGLSLLFVSVAALAADSDETLSYSQSASLATYVAQQYPGAEAVKHVGHSKLVISSEHLQKSFSYDIQPPLAVTLVRNLSAAFASTEGNQVERIPSLFPVLYRVLAQALTGAASAEVREAATAVLGELAANPTAIRQLRKTHDSVDWASPERIAVEYLATKLFSPFVASNDFFHYLGFFMIYGSKTASTAEVVRLLDAWATDISVVGMIPGDGVPTFRDLANLRSIFGYTAGFAREANHVVLGSELVAKLQAVTLNLKREYVRTIETRGIHLESEEDGRHVIETLVEFSGDSNLELAKEATALLATGTHHDATIRTTLAITSSHARPELRLVAIAARARLVKHLTERAREAFTEQLRKSLQLYIFARLARSSTESPEIRAAAHDALTVITPALITALNSGSHHPPREVEEALVKAIGETGTVEAIRELQRLARDHKDSELGDDAFNQLLVLGRGNADDHIIDHLSTKAIECGIYLASPDKLLK